MPQCLLQAPPTKPKKLTGIARMAAESDDAEERNDVDYNWIDCRSTLNRVNGSRVDFEWSINPYRGCEFGCTYCYARYSHDFMELKGPFDFERKIFIKRGAAEHLKRELARGRCPEGETIVIGAATDPYQPAEKRFRITRSILEVLARFSGYRIEIITKSDLIVRDLDLLKVLAARHCLQVNMTVTTTDPALQRITEPRATTPRRRLAALKRLRREGIRAGVFLMPVMPGINDDEEKLESVVRAASEAKADFLSYSILFLTPSTWRRFDLFLGEHYPKLKKRYHDFYGRQTYVPESYRARTRQRIKRLRKKYGLVDCTEGNKIDPPRLGPWQPMLFEAQSQ